MDGTVPPVSETQMDDINVCRHREEDLETLEGLVLQISPLCPIKDTVTR